MIEIDDILSSRFKREIIPCSNVTYCEFELGMHISKRIVGSNTY